MTYTIKSLLPLDRMPHELAEKVQRHTETGVMFMSAVLDRLKLMETKPVLNDHIVFESLLSTIASWQYLMHNGDIDAAMRVFEELVASFREAHKDGVLNAALQEAQAEESRPEPQPEPAPKPDAPMPTGEVAQLHDDPDAAAADEEHAAYENLEQRIEQGSTLPAAEKDE